MYLELVYIYVHNKGMYLEKLNRLIIWNRGNNNY
jgi:hypothetical protein